MSVAGQSVFFLNPFAVLDPIEPGYSVRVPLGAVRPTCADETEAHSLAYTDEQASVVVEDSDRLDLDVMEHPIILYPSDYVETDDGGRWVMPYGLPALVLARDRQWTHRQISAEHTRQSRLRRFQEQR